MFVPRTSVNRCQITGDVQLRVLLSLPRECDFVANLRGNLDIFGELERESFISGSTESKVLITSLRASFSMNFCSD